MPSSPRWKPAESGCELQRDLPGGVQNPNYTFHVMAGRKTTPLMHARAVAASAVAITLVLSGEAFGQAGTLDPHVQRRRAAHDGLHA
jgi:hypothetical protein